MFQQAVRHTWGGLPGGVNILCLQQALHNLQNDCFWKQLICILYKRDGDFPGGSVENNPTTNAGDTSWIPDPGRLHVPRSS